MSPREEATRWLVLQDERELSAGEQQTFEEWLRDPNNQTAWREAQRSWTIFQNVDESSPAAEDLAELRRSALQLRPDSTPAIAPIRPAAPRPARGNAPRWAMAAGVAVLAIGGALLWRQQAGSDVSSAPTTAAQVSAPIEYTTAIGEHREVRLADGSRVLLNTGTTLEARFTGSQRLIELRQGQATFFVAKDASKPFIVHAGERSVRAVGTVFDVRVGSDQLKVLLAEGKVIVSRDDGDHEQPLAPGQLLTVMRTADHIENVDVTRALRWHEGQVEFNDESLQNAVAEMSRYTQRRVTIRDEQTAALRISGLFHTDDMERFLGDIQELLPIRIVTVDGGRTEIAPRE